MTINRLNQGTTNQVLVKAISGQTTNLLELQDSSGNVVSSIGPTGALGGTIGNSGLVHINTTSFSAVSAASLPNDTFTSDFENYRIIGIFTGTVTTQLRVRVRASGTDLTGSDYVYSAITASNGGSVQNRNTSGTKTAFFELGDVYSTVEGNSFAFDIFRPKALQKTTVTGTSFWQIGGTTVANEQFTALVDNSLAYDSLTTLVPSGAITGFIKVYGYKD